MSQRLFYDDAYLSEFSARVVQRLEMEGRPAVVLDRTAFYPAGGGQPHDRGWLSGVDVIDVCAVGDSVVHVLAKQIPAEELDGRLDWERRFDHMQQHTGQHILSQACIRTMGAETVGFHLGEVACTIDLARPQVALEQLAEAEQLANTVICENRAITTQWVDAEEVDAFPLRRPPKVEKLIRVVQVAGFDWSACGGTHLRCSAEVGLVKTLSAERHRGGTTRVTFVCGKRALADYTRKHELIRSLGAYLTTGEEDLLSAVQGLSDELKEARRALSAARELMIEAEAQRLYREATKQDDLVVLQAVYSTPSWSAAEVAGLAKRLAGYPDCVALLGWVGDKSQLTFARGGAVGADMGRLMRIACGAIGGRGGGRPDWAQGGSAADASLEKALAAATEALVAATSGLGDGES